MKESYLIILMTVVFIKKIYREFLDEKKRGVWYPFSTISNFMFYVLDRLNYDLNKRNGHELVAVTLQKIILRF